MVNWRQVSAALLTLHRTLGNTWEDVAIRTVVVTPASNPGEYPQQTETLIRLTIPPIIRSVPDSEIDTSGGTLKTGDIKVRIHHRNFDDASFDPVLLRNRTTTLVFGSAILEIVRAGPDPNFSVGAKPLIYELIARGLSS